jgi:hypothetical protein
VWMCVTSNSLYETPVNEWYAQVGQQHGGPAGVKPGAWRADWGSLRNKAMLKDIAASIEQSLVATMVSTLIPPKVRLF